MLGGYRETVFQARQAVTTTESHAKKVARSLDQSQLSKTLMGEEEKAKTADIAETAYLNN